MPTETQQASLSIRPVFWPFYRNWRGWRYVLWWAWPIRWAMVETSPGCRSTRFYDSAEHATAAMARRAKASKRPPVDWET